MNCEICGEPITHEEVLSGYLICEECEAILDEEEEEEYA